MADPQKGFWLLPSRQRPHNLRRFFTALADMKTSTPGLVAIQKAEFDGPLKEAYDALKLPPNWRVIPTEGDSQGDKLREMEPLYMGCDWVGLIGDDQVVRTEEWDTKLIGALKGWNLISCFDDWQSHQRGGRIAGTLLFSGDLLRTAGYIFPPGMHHIMLDDAWEEVGAATGCWEKKLDVFIEHYHFTKNTAPHDETYVLAYNYGRTDAPTFHQWRANGRLQLQDRIIQLMRRYGVK